MPPSNPQATDRLSTSPLGIFIRLSRALKISIAPSPRGHRPIPFWESICAKKSKCGYSSVWRNFTLKYPLPMTGQSEFRFAFDNPSYSWCDAIILFCMIRELQPRRIIEVGSGHTSCLILDTNELFFGGGIECHLCRTLSGTSSPAVTTRGDRANRYHRPEASGYGSRDLLPAFGPNDILFIDSSHVAKAGSDVQALFSNILPALSPGVVVHLHDIFAGFEYPPEWLREGRGWNEQYMLRAFLQFNTQFRIKLFTGHMLSTHPDFFHQHMPNCFRNGGGNFWMERVPV